MDAPELIADYLRRNGLSQSDFAARLNVTQGLVSQWIKRRTLITAEKAVLIERATGGELSRRDLLPDLFAGENSAA